MNSFSPRITVATIVERDGRFLLVRERDGERLVLNQPAGHVEAGETLAQAAWRETLEETAWQVDVSAFLGVYIYQPLINGPVFHRYCFVAEPRGHDPHQRLDDDIVEAVWLTQDELAAADGQHRSPLVARCIQDYLAGRRLPLDVIYQHPWPLQQA